MVYTFIVVFCVLIVIELYMQFFGNYCEPYFDKKEKIVKRKPNTKGVYKTEFTNSGYFRINNEGWNSHRNYFRRQESGDGNQEFKKLRIAIVGHSNIEGLRVHIDKTLSKVLEDDLNDSGFSAEVYTFGYGGMHLAQALHISRYVVQTFKPDLLIVGTFLDDFLIESTKKKNFMTLKVKNNNQVEEIVPNKCTYGESSVFTLLYFSNFFYYADKKTGIGKKIYYMINQPTNTINLSESNFNIETSKKIGLNYIFNEFKKIIKINPNYESQIFFINFPLVLPSSKLDSKKNRITKQKTSMNQSAKIAQDHDFPIIDLEKVFNDDYAENFQKYDFENDHHYNEHAHELIGKYSSYYIKQFYLSNC